MQSYIQKEGNFKDNSSTDCGTREQGELNLIKAQFSRIYSKLNNEVSFKDTIQPTFAVLITSNTQYYW